MHRLRTEHPLTALAFVFASALLVLIISVFVLVSKAHGAYGRVVSTANEAISCGDAVSAQVSMRNAFDFSTATVWTASQAVASTTGAACIGQRFANGVGYNVGQVLIRQTGAGALITSGKMQYANDCINWTTSDTWTLGGANTDAWFNVTDNGIHECWRLLANANPTTNAWALSEFSLYELVVGTATPLPTSTPTTVPTATATLTPTIDTMAYATLSSGSGVVISRSATFGEMMIFGALIVVAILVLMSMFRFINKGD